MVYEIYMDWATFEALKAFEATSVARGVVMTMKTETKHTPGLDNTYRVCYVAPKDRSASCTLAKHADGLDTLMVGHVVYLVKRNEHQIGERTTRRNIERKKVVTTNASAKLDEPNIMQNADVIMYRTRPEMQECFALNGLFPEQLHRLTCLTFTTGTKDFADIAANQSKQDFLHMIHADLIMLFRDNMAVNMKRLILSCVADIAMNVKDNNEARFALRKAGLEA